MTTLENAPPSGGQTAAVALIGIAILLFAAVFFAVLAHAVRRDREDA